jgi:hypothetical protein
MIADPVALIAEAPTADWDAVVVDPPGGHVYQSVAWADHWRAAGLTPLFISVGPARVLAIRRSWPVLPGGSAYLSRGPAPTLSGDHLGRVLWDSSEALARSGVDVVAADPEVPASDEAFAGWLDRTRFRRIEELQPSRHRLTLPLQGSDEAAAFTGLAKATRQRIRKAEPDIQVVRFDSRVATEALGGATDDPGAGFTTPREAGEVALRRFYDMLRETGERRAFTFGPPTHFVAWWLRALSAGHLVYLEARTVGGDEPLGGLVLYRHGHRFTTVHSADRTATRRAHPGVMHVLRWRAVQLAIRESSVELDMGGVDLPGARRIPLPGEPMYGLYEHKQSFGATWLELRGAYERVFRPARYLGGRVISRLLRAR